MAVSVSAAVRLVRRASLDFSTVADPRTPSGRRYKLEPLLRLMVVATACLRTSLRLTEYLGRNLLPRARLRRLGLPRGPSDTALYELLARLSPSGFREVLWRQLRQAIDSKEVRNDAFKFGVVAIDGKGAGGSVGEAPNEWVRSTVCDVQGTPCWHLFFVRCCLVSSFARVVLDQEVVGQKDGENTVFPTIFGRLVETFPKLFRLVTADAGYLSRANAEIVLAAGKDYLFAFKGSFRNLYPLARTLLQDKPVLATTVERYKGERVTRELRRASPPEDFAFPGVQQLWSVRQVRESEKGSEEETRIFVTSLDVNDVTADEALRLVRMHWLIENGPNWTMDVKLLEDTRGACMTGHGAVVTSWIRILGYNIVSIVRSQVTPTLASLVSWRDAADHVLICMSNAYLPPERAARLAG